MTNHYSISGMTCNGCLAKVKGALESIKGIETVTVNLTYPQASIESNEKIDLEQLETVLKKIGDYNISSSKIEKELSPLPQIKVTPKLSEKSFSTYKPLIIIVSFILGVSLLAQYPFGSFNPNLWMRHFMAGFFIVFSFFKLLNIQGFSSSFRMYDIIAAKWKTWGLIYPFVELILGVLYLINFLPVTTNLLTIIVLGIGTIGVIKSNLSKKEIKCACLGDVFNLPMGMVTIIENVTMIIMAIIMYLILV